MNLCLRLKLGSQEGNEIGLRRRISPMCTLSQNGYGEKHHSVFNISLGYLACLLSTSVGKVSIDNASTRTMQLKECLQKEAN